MVRLLELSLLAMLFVGLNAFKPLQVDDAAYYYYAAHIANHPLDPYGFEVFWYQAPEPAQDVLAPPVLPYWWAAAIRLFGHHPPLWKFWLLPFSACFVFSLDALFRTFARGLDRPLVWMTVLSPTFLPSLNLMLDVPALSLSLAAIALCIRAADRDRLWLALVAGVTAGLAMETKYTAFLGPAAMMLYAATLAARADSVTWRARLAKLRPGLVAAGVAVALFVAWESFMAWRYGESHFLHELRGSDETPAQKLLLWSLPLLTLLGGVGTPLVALGLVALGFRGLLIAAAGGILVAGYLAVALVPAEIDVAAYVERLGLTNLEIDCCSLAQAVFGVFGAALLLIDATIAWRLLQIPWRRRRPDFLAQGKETALGRFLALWLLLELAGYFALTPFGAVRRVMGIVVVSTLLIGRLASTKAGLLRTRIVVGVAVAGIALGMGFYVVDLLDARAWRAAAQSAAAFIRARDPNARIWYVGHWGFQFYAEDSGMRAVVPAAHPSREPLRVGEWLVVPDPRLEQQRLAIRDQDLELLGQSTIQDVIPLRTVRCFYGTSTGVPLEYHHGPRASVKIYRVKAEFEPQAELGEPAQGVREQ